MGVGGGEDLDEKKLKEIMKKILAELPLGSELDVIAVDAEIDVLLKREDAFEVLEPIGIAIMQGNPLTPEQENVLKEQLIGLMK